MGSGLVFFTITVAVLLAFVTIDKAEGAAFVKYDGFDGESQDPAHKGWIDLLSFDWDAKQPGTSASGQSRRRGAVIVDDVTLTMQYDKASPEIMRKMLEGKIIPKLEIEQTAMFGGQEQTYLKWELCNVLVSDYSISGDASSIPTVVVGNNFEEIKVTYTEYDSSTGAPKGKVEVGYNVQTGTTGPVRCAGSSGGGGGGAD